MTKAREPVIAWRGVIGYLTVSGALLGALVLIVRALPAMSGPAAGLASLAMVTPALAAIIVRLVRREGFADAGLRLGPLRWYLVAWLLPIGMVALDFGWVLLFGPGGFDLSAERLAALNPGVTEETYEQAFPGLGTEHTLLLMALVSLTVANGPMLLVGLGEEFGWRGYLLPRLLPLGRVRAFLLVGVVWWAWHLPLTLLSPVQAPVNEGLVLVTGLLGAVCFGAVLGWLRYASTSIFPVALAHIVYNNASGAGHIMFDVDLNGLAVSRVVNVALVCLVISWLRGWNVVPDGSTPSGPEDVDRARSEV